MITVLKFSAHVHCVQSAELAIKTEKSCCSESRSEQHNKQKTSNSQPA